MAVSNTPEFSKFRVILSELLCADNETRTKAEASYDEISATDKTLFLLTSLNTEGVSAQEAELAAILLRRLFSSDFEAIFSKLPPNVFDEIKSQLLQQIQQLSEHNLRRKVCDVTSELARNAIDDDGNNHWPEFLKFLFDSASSTDPGLREMALYLFASVPGVFGNLQDRYIHVIHQMLSQSLSDQTSVEVRYSAVKAATSFLLAHEKESLILKQFNDCIGLILQFFSEALEDPNGRPEEISHTLIELAECCAQCFRSHVDILFPLCLKCLTSQNHMDSCRHLALEVLVSLSESAPPMVRKVAAKHIPPLVSIILQMMTDIEDDEKWDFYDGTDDYDSDCNSIVAEAAVDRLACALGGKTVLPVVLQSLPQMLNSTNWKERCASLMAISAIGEGCHKQMTTVLSQIVLGIFPYLSDSHSRVRYATCNALGQMSTDFAPTFQKKFHEKVIPGLLQLLDDLSSPKVQAHAGAALVNFFEECPKSILLPYLKDITEKLEKVMTAKLSQLAEGGPKLVLEQTVVTLAALADTCEEKFTDYYEKFMPLLKFIIQSSNSDYFKELRGKTIECVSLIGLAVGKEKFINDAGEVMDILLKSQTNPVAMRDDDPQLSYMIAAWARICKILGKGFEPYLPYVMEPVLKAASLKPEIAVLDSEDIKAVENDDEWEFVNLGEKRNFGIRTAGLEEKATACQMLICYARELKDAFAPYVEETTKLMLPMLKFYFHDSVRAAAAEILPYLLECAKSRGDAYVQEMWRYVLSNFLQALESEPEAEVLCEEMAAFAHCLEVLKFECLSHEDLLFLTNWLNKKLTEHFEKSKDRDQRRKGEDYDDMLEEELELEDDDDIYILSKICDVVSTLFSTYKEKFFPYFDMLLPQFLHLLEPTRPHADKQWSLCVFADVIQYGGPLNDGPLSSKYQQYFLQPIIESLKNENADLRQTAAYCIGCLAQYGGLQFAQVCADSIPLLIAIINDPEARSEENIRPTENAISAITKMLASNNSLINVEEIFPVWITWLPIWEDTDEVIYVNNFLCSLLETNNPLLLGRENCNLPRIVSIIAETFAKEAIESTSEVGQRIVTLMRDIQANVALFSACMSGLTPAQQTALMVALN